MGPGELNHRIRALGRGLFGTVLLAALLILPDRGHGQDPPAADTIPRDPVPADTVPPLDPPPGEDEEEEPVRSLPEVPRPVPPGWSTGVWEWDEEDLRSTRALTLYDLLSEVPGIIPLRGGDVGQPTAVTGGGGGPGGVRIFRDGIELPPLDGGTVDLARVGLVGVERVRVERRPAEVRVHLSGTGLRDPRPLSFLEVGTGDLNTNLFRGTFGHPGAPGGHFLIGLDRIDTEGPFREEPGASFGTVVRYTFLPGDRWGLSTELRRMSSRRPPPWEPRNVDRSDWNLAGRFRVADGLVAHGFYQRSSLGLDSDLDPQDPARRLVNTGTRSQLGLSLSWARERWWAEGVLRSHAGDGWPSSVQELEVGGTFPGIGGASLSLEREGWPERSAGNLHARVWSRPLLGVSVFAEVEDGTRGERRFVPPPPLEEEEEENGDEDGEEAEEEEAEPEPLPPTSFTDRRALRAGAEFVRGDLALGAAGLLLRADTLHPSGLPMDRGGPSAPGGERRGVELFGAVPLTPVLDGLVLRGNVRFWESGGPWPYLPLDRYEARIAFHDVFLDTRNLEVWADVGVRGRDRMLVPVAGEEDQAVLAEVPSFQSWFARVQVRIVTFRIFVDWDNFTTRDENQDVPDRLLPPMRLLVGVRWTLWN